MRRPCGRATKSSMRKSCAPRNARLNLWRSQKKFGEILLGHPIYLKMKVGGEKSISEKRESLEDAEGVVLQGPCDMAKAELPEPQFPVVDLTLVATASKSDAVGSVSSDFCDT